MLPELTVDVAAFSRALEHALATGFVDLVAKAAGEELGRSLRERLSGLELVARAAPPDLDQLAAMLLQGMLADESCGKGAEYTPEKAAARAYDFAVALRAEGQRRALPVAARPWFCTGCQRIVPVEEVTAEELHEACGSPCGDPPGEAPEPEPAPIDWTAWEADGDGLRLRIDNHLAYEIARNAADTFDLFWVEGTEVRERVGQPYATADDAMRAAYEDYHRIPSQETRR